MEISTEKPTLITIATDITPALEQRIQSELFRRNYRWGMKRPFLAELLEKGMEVVERERGIAPETKPASQEQVTTDVN